MLFKMIDNVRVEMTAEEEAAVRAEWAADDARRAAPPAKTPDKIDRLVTRLQAKGVLSAAEADALK